MGLGDAVEDIDDSDHSSDDLSKTIEMANKKTRTKITCECGESFRNLDRLKSHQRSEHEGLK